MRQNLLNFYGYHRHKKPSALATLPESHDADAKGTLQIAMAIAMPRPYNTKDEVIEYALGVSQVPCLYTVNADSGADRPLQG